MPKNNANGKEKLVGEKSGPSIRHVKFATLESWLLLLNNQEVAPEERIAKVRIAIAWTLGKDSKVANEVITNVLA